METQRRFLDLLHASEWAAAESLARSCPESIMRLLDSRGWNALHYAVWNDCTPELAAILVSELGISVHSTDARGNTCMHDAAFQDCRPTLVRQLIALGGNANLRNSQGETAVYEASYRAQPELMRVLLTEGEGDVRARTRRGCTPLLAAVRERAPIQVVALLLQHGAGTTGLLQVIDYTGNTALSWAERRYPSALQLMLKTRVMEAMMSPYYTRNRNRRNKCLLLALPPELVRMVGGWL